MANGRGITIYGALAALVFLLFAGCATVGSPAGPVAVRVLFTVKASSAVAVAVVGSFNQWDPERHRLSGPGPDGTWRAELSLLPGRYEYLFLINGTTWVLDASASSVDDGLGGRNSVVIVEAE
jgi:1,4-alpha-glucan branching enzyme